MKSKLTLSAMATNGGESKQLEIELELERTTNIIMGYGIAMMSFKTKVLLKPSLRVMAQTALLISMALLDLP